MNEFLLFAKDHLGFVQLDNYAQIFIPWVDFHWYFVDLMKLLVHFPSFVDFHLNLVKCQVFLGFAQLLLHHHLWHFLIESYVHQKWHGMIFQPLEFLIIDSICFAMSWISKKYALVGFFIKLVEIVFVVI